MNKQDIQRSLAKRDQTVEITTTGRRTGRPHRIEVRLHNVDGRLFITGGVGKRDWYANVRATPAFTLHLKQDIAAALEAHATPIVDDAERRSVLRPLLDQSGHLDQLEERLASSPLIHVEVSL